jgi:hypothetical protein
VLGRVDMGRRIASALSVAAILNLACHPPGQGQGSDSGSQRALDAQPMACPDGAGCAPDHFCRFTPGLCGKGRRPGACEARPASCPDAVAPVCGCDGRSYTSECAAHAAGVDLAVMGGCKDVIPDFAPCGPRYCDTKTSYCEIFLSDVFELPTDYFCRPLPASCLAVDGSVPTCGCFPAGTRCSQFCGPLPTAPGGRVGFHLTCQGRHPPAE